MISQVLYFLGNTCVHPERNKRKPKVFRFLDALAEINSNHVIEEEESDAEDYEDEEEAEMRRMGM